MNNRAFCKDWYYLRYPDLGCLPYNQVHFCTLGETLKKRDARPRFFFHLLFDNGCLYLFPLDRLYPCDKIFSLAIADYNKVSRRQAKHVSYDLIVISDG